MRAAFDLADRTSRTEHKKVAAKLRKLVAQREKLRSLLPEGQRLFESSEVHLHEWRKHRHNEIQLAIQRTEATLAFVSGTVKRHQNHSFIFNSEKAAARRKTTKLKEDIEHFKVLLEKMPCMSMWMIAVMTVVKVRLTVARV